MWKFCGKAQFPHYAETLPIHKVSVPGTKVKLPYFTQSRQSLSLIGNIYAVTKYLDCKYPKKFWLFFFHFLHLFYLSGFNFAERCICLFRQRKKKLKLQLYTCKRLFWKLIYTFFSSDVVKSRNISAHLANVSVIVSQAWSLLLLFIYLKLTIL